MCEKSAPQPRELVLASRSPQRRAILERLCVRFKVEVPDVCELSRGAPVFLVTENALRKARAVGGELVLGVDTAVFLGSRNLGKPQTDKQAKEFLHELSGRWHDVYSGICLREKSRELTGWAHTRVSFRSLGEPEIDCYVASGEWQGRAGGYAIQGRGAGLVSGIRGDYWNVVGLPVNELIRLLPNLFAR